MDLAEAWALHEGDKLNVVTSFSDELFTGISGEVLEVVGVDKDDPNLPILVADSELLPHWINVHSLKYVAKQLRLPNPEPKLLTGGVVLPHQVPIPTPSVLLPHRLPALGRRHQVLPRRQP